MDRFGPLGRLAAGLVALVAATGLAVQFAATQAGTGSVPETLWILLRFFTILANLWLAFEYGGWALGRRRNPHMLAGATLSILLVGVIYMLLLRGLLELSGGDRLADIILHWVTPVLAPLVWLAFAPKGLLRGRDPLLWSLFPFAYLVYALVRGEAEGAYAYPFLDVDRLGWPAMLGIAALMATGFIAAGYAMVLLDHRLGRRASRA